MQRIGFGLLLIVAFSVGLAAVLIAIGVLMVYTRQFMARFHGEEANRDPLAAFDFVRVHRALWRRTHLPSARERRFRFGCEAGNNYRPEEKT